MKSAITVIVAIIFSLSCRSFSKETAPETVAFSEENKEEKYARGVSEELLSPEKARELFEEFLQNGGARWKFENDRKSSSGFVEKEEETRETDAGSKGKKKGRDDSDDDKEALISISLAVGLLSAIPLAVYVMDVVFCVLFSRLSNVRKRPTLRQCFLLLEAYVSRGGDGTGFCKGMDCDEARTHYGEDAVRTRFFSDDFPRWNGEEATKKARETSFWVRRDESTKYYDEESFLEGEENYRANVVAGRSREFSSYGSSSSSSSSRQGKGSDGGVWSNGGGDTVVDFGIASGTSRIPGRFHDSRQTKKDKFERFKWETKVSLHRDFSYSRVEEDEKFIPDMYLRDNFITALLSASKIMMVGALITGALFAMNTDPYAVFLFSGVAWAALWFQGGFSDMFRNYLCFFIIRFSNKFHVGSIVGVEGFLKDVGCVVSITPFCTIIMVMREKKTDTHIERELLMMDVPNCNFMSYPQITGWRWGREELQPSQPPTKTITISSKNKTAPGKTLQPTLSSSTGK